MSYTVCSALKGRIPSSAALKAGYEEGRRIPAVKREGIREPGKCDLSLCSGARQIVYIRLSVLFANVLASHLVKEKEQER